MSSINLLPSDLRGKEAKGWGRRKGRTRKVEVELSYPEKQKAIGSLSDKPKVSLWRKIFGSSKKRAFPPVKTEEKTQPAPSSLTLKSAQKNEIKFSTAKSGMVKPLPAKKPFFWNRLFNRPSRLKRSKLKKVKPAKKIKSLKVEPKPKIKFKSPEPPKIRRSWWPFKHQIKKPKAPQPVVQKPLPPRPPKPEPEPARPSTNRPKVKKKSWFSLFFGAKREKPKLVKVKPAKKTIKKQLEPKKLEPKKSKYHLAEKTEKSKLHINLIPEELMFKKRVSRSRKVVYIALAIIIPVFIITGLYYLVDYYQEKLDFQLAQKQQEANKLAQAVADYQKIRKQTLLLQQKVFAINGLLDKHIYWTPFFTQLEKYTLDTVHYTSFAVDTSGKFSLPAVATSYDEAAKQIVVFRQAKDFIKSVAVDNVALVSDNRAGIVGVGLEFKLEAVDNIFQKTDN